MTRGRLALFSLAIGGFTAWAHGAEPGQPMFERDIKPLFARHCTVCHRASKRASVEISGGLALDSYDAVLAGTGRVKVVIPGRSGQSALVLRLALADPEKRMPLEDKPLPEPEQELVRRWIDQGAPRGDVMHSVAAASATRGAVVRSRRLSPVRALEVVLPTNVTLPAGRSNGVKGGSLSLALPVGPLPAVSALALRGDSGLLAVGTFGHVVFWNLHEGAPAGELADIPGAVHALAFSRDGRRLAVGAGLPARSGVVRVYSVPDGTLLRDFEGHEDVVYSVALRPDGAQLASASFDQTVRLWNLGSGQSDGVFAGHSDFVYSVAYTPDGHALLTGGKDRTVKRISVRTLKEERTYSDHDEDVVAVAVHPDGKRMVSAGNEPQLRWWNLDGDKPTARRGGHSGPVQQLAFSADGRRLISASGDRSIRLWDGKTGAAIRSLPGPVEWQYSAILSDDAKLAAAGGWDGLVRLWDAETGRLKVTMVQPPDHPTKSQGARAAGPTWLAITPDGHVAGSTELLQSAIWRAGGVALPTEAARAVCVSQANVARAMRGETVKPVEFPTGKGN